jgi:hypothetical protein
VCTYNQWLKTVSCQETVDYFEETRRDVTNGELLARPESERPVEWWNGFTATQEEIDVKRKASKNSYEWYKEVQKYAPFLDAKEERGIKKIDTIQSEVDTCGHLITRINKQGILVKVHKHCNHPELCLKCKRRMEKELRDRLNSLDGCRFLEVEDKKLRAELIEKYGKDKVYCKPVEGDKVLVVIDTDDEIGAEFTHEHANQYATIHQRYKGKW